MLIDLDELPALDRDVAGFAHNRFGLFSFYDRDHGLGRNEALKPWVLGELANAGVETNNGPVRLLCYPRMIGYAFNPLSVYFCYRPNGELAAILHQVNNTFHQRHSYLFPVTSTSDEIVRQTCIKELYVSPFIKMGMTYNFRIKPPAGDVAVSIHESDDQGALLFASFAGERKPFLAKVIRQLFWSYPLMTLKVVGGIHWEALRLWIKGVPLVQRPEPPPEPVTVIRG